MLEFTVIPLTDLLELVNDKGEEGLSDVKADLGKFSCKKNGDLENFLHNDCLEYEKSSECRTFLI